MEQAVLCKPHSADRSGPQVRGKTGWVLENNGGCGRHSSDHEIVGFQSQRFDPEKDAAGVGRFAQRRLFSCLQGRAELVKQRCIQYGF